MRKSITIVLNVLTVLIIMSCKWKKYIKTNFKELEGVRSSETRGCESPGLVAGNEFGSSSREASTEQSLQPMKPDS